MKQRRSLFAVMFLALSSLTVGAGCESGFVTDAARTSASSFITSVVSTAVNAALGGD